MNGILLGKLALCVLMAQLTAATLCQSAQRRHYLKMGDPAPRILVRKWLKGSPVDLKDGKVHVVEFWATWCGPCIGNMAHLSNLADKYRAVADFAGVDIWEQKYSKDPTVDPLTKVEEFVANAQDRMAYHVAIDTVDGEMARNWMDSFGFGGIPEAFVVDQKGRIVWQGHPMFELDDVLSLVSQGKYTPGRAAQLSGDWRKRKTEYFRLEKELAASLQVHDDTRTLALVNAMTDLVPWNTDGLSDKYRILAQSDVAAAHEFGLQILKQHNNDPGALKGIASVISDEHSAIYGKRDYLLAAEMLLAAASCDEPDYNYVAQMFYQGGDLPAAIRYQAKAVKLAQANPAQRGQIANLANMLKRYQSQYGSHRP